MATQFDVSSGDILQRTDNPDARWRVESLEGDQIHLKDMAGSDTLTISRDDLYDQFVKVSSA